MDAPKGYIFDKNSGMYYLEEQGVVDNKPARIINWFNPKDGSINKATYPLDENENSAADSAQDTQEEPKNKFEIPSGYIPYPGTDLFYISETVKDDSGAQIQQVTYFNPVTGEYNKVDYPQESKIEEPQKPKFSPPPPPSQNKAKSGQKKISTPLVITIIVLVVLGIIMLTFWAFIGRIKKAANSVNGQDTQNISGQNRDENIILGTDGSTIDGLKLEVVAKSSNEAKFIISNIKLNKEFPAPAKHNLPENEYAYVWRINMGGCAVALHSVDSSLTTPVAYDDLKSSLWKLESATSVRKYNIELSSWLYSDEIIIDNVVLPENSGIDFRTFNDYNFEYKYIKDRGKGNITAKITYNPTTTTTTTKQTTTEKTTAKKTTAKKAESSYFGTYGGGEKGKISINKSGNYTMTINTGFGYVTASGRAFFAPNENIVYLYVDNNFGGNSGFAGDKAREVVLKKSGNTLTMTSPGQLGLISSGHKFRK